MDHDGGGPPAAGAGRQGTAGLLAQAEPFAGLGAEDLGRVARALKSRRYPAGTLIFSRGDPGDFALLVEEGRVRISVMSGEGRELSLRIAGPGTLVGEIALLDGGARTADASAMTDVAAQILSRAEFGRLMEASPALSRAVVAMLCRRLRDTTDQLESIALHRIEARLARLLLSLARQVDPNAGASVRLHLDLSQSDLADIVGASRPKVNRALLAMQEAGAIQRKGADLVCRLDRLTAVAEEPEGGS
ncbi:Crp/Fnr family transcriptional regulator [Prosthecomicrobium sp. N25]|uniref:Crp/Fnr family transcriptional regulator n=1 Tax=Prosthecomicrobium sp. N25 TaxID=3129254 RepID=UPI0030789476